MFSAWFFTQVGASIVVLTVMFYLLAYAGLFLVRFTLNADKWPNFYDFNWLHDKLWKHSSVFTYGGVIVHITEKGGGFVVRCDDQHLSELCDSYFLRYTHSKHQPHVFTTYEEAVKVVKDKFTEKETVVPYGVRSLMLLPIGVALDVVFLCLSLEPVATVSVLITVGTVLSIRWLSGKAADTAKKVLKHEDDINELKTKS